jgi:hypothetical protein
LYWPFEYIPLEIVETSISTIRIVFSQNKGTMW